MFWLFHWGWTDIKSELTARMKHREDSDVQEWNGDSTLIRSSV